MKQNRTFYQPHRLNPRRTRAIFWILAPLVLMSMAASAARADIASLQVGAYQSTPTLVGPGDSYTVQFWSKLKADESHVENLYDTGETWTITSVKYSDDDVNWQTIWSGTPGSSVTLGFPYDSSFTLSGGVGGASLDAGTQPTTATGFYMVTVSDKADYTATVNGTQTSGTTQPATAPTTEPVAKIAKVTVGSPATQTNMLHDIPNQGDINYGAVKKSVDQKITNAKASATTDPATTKVEDKIVWSNGTAVSGGNNTERNYSLANSQKFTINPTLAGHKWAGHNVYLWVIWATVTIDGTQGNGEPQGAPLFSIDTTHYGGNKTGLFYNNAKDSVDYQVVQIAKMTPNGIHHVLFGGCKMKQDRNTRDFIDVTNHGGMWTNDWKSDNPASSFYTDSPDTNDKVYATDDPAHFLKKTQYDIYHNFRDYLTWNDVECSDKTESKAHWYFQAGAKKNANPVIYFADGNVILQIPMPNNDPEKAEIPQ